VEALDLGERLQALRRPGRCPAARGADWRYADIQQLIAAAFAGQVLNDLEQPEVKKLLGQN